MQSGQGGPPPGGYGAPRPHQDRSPYGLAPGPQGGQMQGYGPNAGMYQPFGATCPSCQSHHLTRPSFTWWGGLLGPKLLNHTVCGGCGLGFNAKTGKSNRTAIGIYLGVGVALGLALAILRFAI